MSTVLAFSSGVGSRISVTGLFFSTTASTTWIKEANKFWKAIFIGALWNYAHFETFSEIKQNLNFDLEFINSWRNTGHLGPLSWCQCLWSSTATNSSVISVLKTRHTTTPSNNTPTKFLCQGSCPLSTPIILSRCRAESSNASAVVMS